jgi:two-component system phosphate regulon response regulator PhoB
MLDTKTPEHTIQSNHKTLLIVEDEPQIAALLVSALQSAGWQVSVAQNLRSAEMMLRANPPHLLLLDWMLPDGDGIIWLSRIRQIERFARLPTLVLTARSDKDDLVTALQKGADDYLSKPFSLKELIARLDALFRRYAQNLAAKPMHESKSTSPQEIEQDGWSLSTHNRILSLTQQHPCFNQKGQSIRLSPTEYQLLRLLMLAPSKVFDRSRLSHALLMDNPDERTVDAHMMRLRKKLKLLDPNMPHLKTIRSLGYVWRDSSTSL